MIDLTHLAQQATEYLPSELLLLAGKPSRHRREIGQVDGGFSRP